MSTHIEPLRVRWNEVDAQGIVFNAQYLAYLDVASTGYWRALGLPYPLALKAFGADVVLGSCALDFRAPARFDEQLDCAVRLQALGRTSLTLSATLRRGHVVLLTAEMRYVVVDATSLQPTPIPEALRQAIQAFEDGQAMVQVKVGDWDALGTDAQPIRQQGFRQVLLHAQASAVGFYRRAGFTPRGTPFEEAGIEHQEMVRSL